MRFLTYSHDACGLGHLRRTFLIGSHVARSFPDVSVLSIIGSTWGQHYFHPGSTNHDYIKIPCAVKIGADQYQPRHLRMEYDDLIGLRRAIITEAVAAFRPDMVIVDKNPRGLGDELAPALERLRAQRPETRIILGLRDVLDDPRVTRPQWQDPERIRWIDRIYDAIWIWGEPDVFDTAQAYCFPDDILRKTKYMGYLPPEEPQEDTEALRQDAGIRNPAERLLLVAAGGGGDALPIFTIVLEGLQQADAPVIQTLLVAGPLMAQEEFNELKRLIQPLGDRIQLRRFLRHFEDWVRASDAVICMGGYNTLREVAALGKPALAIPRRHPRREQVIRVEKFAAHGWCESPEPGRSTREAVTDFCNRLAHDRLSPSLIHLHCRGLDSIRMEIQTHTRPPVGSLMQNLE